MHYIDLDTLLENFEDIVNIVVKYKVPYTLQTSDCPNVVIIDATEYASIIETLHLLSSRKNAERIYEALEEIKTAKPQTIEEMLKEINETLE
jgi:antitoxin YefM